MLIFPLVSNKSSPFFLFLSYGAGDELKECKIYRLRFCPKLYILEIQIT